MNQLLFATLQDTDETNRISPDMDYTRTADAFSQVKAEIVVAGGEVLLVGDGFSELGMTWCFIGEEFAAGIDVMDYYVI